MPGFHNLEVWGRAMRELWHLGLLTRIVIALGMGVPVQAADFTFFDSFPGTGAEGVVMFGEIKPGDELKFKDTVKTITQEGKWVERIYLFSPGGAMPAALSIGEQVYTLRISTFAPLDWRHPGQPKHFVCQAGTINLHYFPDKNSGDPRCTCASACFFHLGRRSWKKWKCPRNSSNKV